MTGPNINWHVFIIQILDKDVLKAPQKVYQELVNEDEG